MIGPLSFLTNSTHPKIQFVVHQCAHISDVPKHLHDHVVKRRLKYPKGTSTQVLILKSDPENRVECYH